MSGKGSEVGGDFRELRAVIDRTALGARLGVLRRFDAEVGLDRLRAVHLNDSKNPLGSRKDRHARIGEGCIGTEALVRVGNHPLLRDLPFYLETPQDDLSGWAAEIAMLRAARK